MVARFVFSAVATAGLLAALSGVALAQEGDPEAGKRVFNKCRACHSVEPGQNKIGPTLAGVVGRPAGSVEDYNYSDAMKEADVVWDPEALDEYLENPREFIPGNKMAFAGLKKEDEREDVIAYLASVGE